MTTSRPVFAALGALLFATTGCGLINVKINEGTGAKPGGGAASPEGAAAAGEAEVAFKAKDASTIAVNLDKGFGPNPRFRAHDGEGDHEPEEGRLRVRLR